MSRLVGVLGGTGAVGQVAAARIVEWGLGEVRIGGRDQLRARALADRLAAQAVRVDLTDPGSLARFCAGCAVVVNCAGPSYLVLDTVARAAAAAGAAYVDAAGDRPVLDALRADPPCCEHPMVLSAGITPGLSGLLPRLLTGLRRLDLYVGGTAVTTPLAAADVLLARGPRFGTAGAAWHSGRVVPGALPALSRLTLPGFDRPVDAHPFLSAEAAAHAEAAGMDELRAYTVHFSDRLPRAIATAWAETGDGRLDPTHVEAVVAATDADVAEFGQTLTLLAAGRRRPGTTGPSRIVVRTSDAAGLSGAVAACAVEQILTGVVTSGAELAAEALDPHAVATRLTPDPVVDEWSMA